MIESMVKKLNVMGIALDYYPMRESLLLIEKFFKDSAMNIVRLVNMEQMVMAGSDDAVREALENTELPVIADRAIFEAAGVEVPVRLGETSHTDFFTEFMRRIYRANRSVYLIGDSRDSLDAFQNYLKEEYKHLNVIGATVVGENDVEMEKVVNDINIVLPDVVMSILPSPQQDYFLNRHFRQIYAKVWLGLSDDRRIAKKSGKIRRFWREHIESRLFHIHVNRFYEQFRDGESSFAPGTDDTKER